MWRGGRNECNKNLSAKEEKIIFPEFLLKLCLNIVFLFLVVYIQWENSSMEKYYY